MLIVDRTCPVSSPVESPLAEEYIGIIALCDDMRDVRRAVICIICARLRQDMHGPVPVERQERIFQRVQVDCQAKGVPGERIGVRCPPEAEAGGIVICYGSRVRTYPVTRPVVIDQMHFPDLIPSREELPENEEHVVRDLRVHDHLSDLDPAVEIVMHHM